MSWIGLDDTADPDQTLTSECKLRMGTLCLMHYLKTLLNLSWIGLDDATDPDQTLTSECKLRMETLCFMYYLKTLLN